MKTDTVAFPPKMYAPQNYTDEDSLPIWAAPRPLLVRPDQMDSLSDLDVSLTPDKISKSTGILKKREGSDGAAVNGGRVSRRQLQVRFDTGSESESCSKEAFIPWDPGSGREGASPVNPALELDPEASESNARALADPSSIFSSDRNGKGPTPGDSWKNKAVKPVRPNKPPRQVGILGGAEDHWDRPLAIPEYNTILALGQELQQLKEAGFDAKRAAAEQLQRSSLTRQCVEGKVAEGLNVPKDLQRYRGLVSLEVPVAEVLSTAVQEKMLLVKPRAENKKVVGTEAPDLMMFYDPSELLTETPYLAVEGLPALKVQAQPRLAASPFDLYRKLKQWEA